MDSSNDLTFQAFLRSTKILYYLLLSVVGVFTAEVMSWSSPQVLYNPLAFPIVVPVYAVHYILFGDLMWRFGRRDGRVLYAFGCLTGMYETFITKVYWSPPWNPQGVGFLGMAWLEVFWIGFSWHALMSFFVPIKLVDTFFEPTERKLPMRTPLPKSIWAILLLMPFVGGILGLGFEKNLGDMLLSVILSLVIIGVVGKVFMASARKVKLAGLNQLAFTRRCLALAIGFFFAVYAIYFIIFRREAIPGCRPRR